MSSNLRRNRHLIPDSLIQIEAPTLDIYESTDGIINIVVLDLALHTITVKINYIGAIDVRIEGRFALFVHAPRAMD